MSLSVTAEYALRAILVLARDGATRPLRADEVADATGAPRNYLAKTLNALTRAGVVSSSRGPSGGFTLAVRPDTLTVAQVVDLFDEPRPQTRCLLGNGPCDPLRPCAAHHCWNALKTASRAPLATTTIASLLAGAPAAPGLAASTAEVPTLAAS